MGSYEDAFRIICDFITIPIQDVPLVSFNINLSKIWKDYLVGATSICINIGSSNTNYTAAPNCLLGVIGEIKNRPYFIKIMLKNMAQTNTLPLLHAEILNAQDFRESFLNEILEHNLEKYGPDRGYPRLKLDIGTFEAIQYGGTLLQFHG